MKKFFNRFVHEEDGAEMVEWAIVIAIAAVLAIPILTLVGTARQKVEQANESLNGIDVNSVAGGTSSSSSTASGGAAGVGDADVGAGDTTP